MANKKVLIALLLVALVGVIGGTFAYYTSTSQLTNEFTTGTYSTTVKESFTSPDNWTPGTTTTKIVNVTNKGSVDVAARARYTEKWTAEDGTDLSLIRDGASIAQFTVGEDWEKTIDGWYYYNDTLSTNETSSNFISAVTFNPNFELKDGIDIKCETVGTVGEGDVEINCSYLSSGYAGATYTLDIIIETIQADQKWSTTTFLLGEDEYEVPIGTTWNEFINDDEYLTSDIKDCGAYIESKCTSTKVDENSEIGSDGCLEFSVNYSLWTCGWE